MKSIFFRCDSSISIGSGHVIRCRTLARELRRRGAQVYFICRPQIGDLIPILKEEFHVLILPELPNVETSFETCALNSRDFYASWLGCSQIQDAIHTINVLKPFCGNSIDYVIVDHYSLDIAWQEYLLENLDASAKPKLFVIDDLADRKHLCDYLLDQNFSLTSPHFLYDNLIQDDCCSFYGPQYALLGPEYPLLHRLSPRRNRLERILIYFGGVDHSDCTSLVLRVLSQPHLKHLSVDVVVGVKSPHRESILELVRMRPNTVAHDFLPSLAGLIVRADLFIGAGGTTSWERSCLRIPSLVLSISDNQISLCDDLHSAGLIHYLGNSDSISCDKLSSLLNSLLIPSTFDLYNPELNITDGFGTSRIATSILGPISSLVLRNACPHDEELILSWANDPSVRSLSISPDFISRSDHHRWFSSILESPDSLLFVGIDADGCPLGQIRFERLLVSSDPSLVDVLISISLDRCARGFGLGRQMLDMGMSTVYTRWGDNIRFNADVSSKNIPSQRIFQKASFSVDPNYEQSSSSTFDRWIYHNN